MASKRSDNPVAEEEHDKLEIMPLGAGNEVGRSCVYMAYKDKHVMFDCGIHPGRSGVEGLPFFDEIDPSTVDVLLVTHFHLDHSASLPYFLTKTNFKGRVFMTHATKAVYRLLLQDFIKVSKGASVDALFEEQDILTSLDKIEVIDFHQIQEVNGIRFWCYTAGHVLGAAMFMVEIAGVRVLYTGDYSREEDRHLRAAETPPFSPDLCIIESTYGIQLHERREDRERRFTDLVTETVRNGGRVLIPAFALGRAQELLLILDELWRNHPELQHIPIYYASPLAKKTMAVYRAYIGSMNDRIRQQSEISNPFDFQYIKGLRGLHEFEDSGPSVVMASPGGLQSGLSRQLFDKWCQDKKNTCLIPGYVVEGTLAKTLLSEPKEVTLSSGAVVPLRMQVKYVSFSAHADFAQTSAFLAEIEPPNIVLVHGEANEMGRLKSKLVLQFAEKKGKVLTPKNAQAVDFYFKGEKVAKAVGKIAEKKPEEGGEVSGLLVKNGFNYQLLHPEDLTTHTQLSIGSILQRQSVQYTGPFGVIRHRLEGLFEGVTSDAAADMPTISIQGSVRIVQQSGECVVLEWESDPVSDMVADSVVALILQLSLAAPNAAKGRTEGEGASEEKTTEGGLTTMVPRRLSPEEILEKHRALLENMFGGVVADKEKRRLTVDFDGVKGDLDVDSGVVECQDEGLRLRMMKAVKSLRAAILPLPIL